MYLVYALGPTSQLPDYIASKINGISFDKDSELISTYTNKILGEDWVYGVFKIK